MGLGLLSQQTVLALTLTGAALLASYISYALQAVNPDELTPREALELLYRLKKLP